MSTDGDRDALANIEAELLRTDPILGRRFSEVLRQMDRPSRLDSLRRWTRRRDRPRTTSEPAADPAAIQFAIVVGSDGHPDSDAALRFAAQEAQLRAARLLVVTAYFEPVDPDLPDIELSESQLRDRAQRTTEQALCRALAVTPALLPAHETITAHGEASKILLNEYGNAAMIVVGAHHRHLLRRLTRSLSRNLIEHSHVPIVVVPPDPRADAFQASAG